MRRGKAVGMLAILICFLVTYNCAYGENIPKSIFEAESDKADHRCFPCSVSWAGSIYTGSYEGEVKDGFQEGEGTFIGESDKGNIEYTGNWVGGRFEGEGVLYESSGNVSYSGTFSDGKRDGLMTVGYSDCNETATVRYAKDVPYGAYIRYNATGSCIETDRFYMGYSLRKILSDPTRPSYSELLTSPEENLHCMIMDYFTILDSGAGFFSGKKESDDNPKTEYGFLVKDRDGNQYIFFMKLIDDKIGKAYAFPFFAGTEMELYGDYTGIGTYMAKDGSLLTLPQIKLVGADWKEYQEISFNCLEMTEENLLRFSAEFYNKEIDLEGTVRSMFQKTEGEVAILLSVTDDIGAGMECLCMVFDVEDIPVSQLTINNKVKVEGTMMDPDIRLEGETLCFHPQVKVQKLMW